MKRDFEKITPCGGDCSDCEHLLNNECEGCLKNGGSRVKLWGKSCSIYECCERHGVKFCGLCGEFPCKEFDRIKEWDKDAAEKHRQMAEEYGEEQAINVYESCPSFENGDFLIRRTEKKDKEDLLKVYSDEKAVRFFNSDNCHGDDFHYTTLERMEQALDFWEESYRGGWFVRFSIVDKSSNRAVGTAELFKRSSGDSFYSGAYGILRLDLGSGYENESSILSILSLLIPPSYRLFGCESIATKAVEEAEERIAALKKYGFEKCGNKLIGNDGTEYGDYYRITERRGK